MFCIASRPSSVAAALVHCVEAETMNGQALLLIKHEKGNDVIRKLQFDWSAEEILETIKNQ